MGKVCILGDVTSIFFNKYKTKYKMFKILLNKINIYAMARSNSKH